MFRNSSREDLRALSSVPNAGAFEHRCSQIGHGGEMANFRKIGLSVVLIVSFAVTGFEMSGGARLAPLVPAGRQSLSADGGAPPAPPIPVPKNNSVLATDGGAPPAPPIPVPKNNSVLAADGGAPPAPPIPLVNA